jgi:PAS domain S-box-containing protein
MGLRALRNGLKYHKMSNENASVKKFLDQINISSTKVVFVIFAVVSILSVVLFFVLIENGRQRSSEQIVDATRLRVQLSDKKNKLAEELLNSFNNSLLFQKTKKETDRFQTVYVLKSTKNLYDGYYQDAIALADSEQLKADFLSLRGLLSSYDQLIAESVNSDGKMQELLTAAQDQPDSLDQYLFESGSLDDTGVDMKAAGAKYDEIKNQLLLIENHLNILIDQEIQAISTRSHIIRYVFFAFIFVLLIVLLASVILIRLNVSVGSLSKVLKNIARGELPDNDMSNESEFLPIVEASNELVQYLDSANQFARHIGEGDFNYEFEPKSQQDALGNSLIEMRNRLQQVAREDKIRNWMNEGHAKFGEILRQHNDDLDELGSFLINNIVEYLGASQGALFVFKEDDDDSHLELLAAYAHNRKKYIQKRIEIGEGLAGQAFSEGKTIYLKEILTDHYNITTGLGESRPSSLLIIPLKEDDKIEGVIEIASLNEIKSYEVEFMESIGESIASSLNSGKVNETTRKLLGETQEKAEEMKAQEEELRQNMEELAATQEQVERRNKELEDVQRKYDEERYLVNALLNSTNDRIYFKDMDCKFVRISKSMIDLFGKKEESEIIGKSDFDFGFEEHARVTYEDEQRIIRTGHSMEDVVEKEKWDDGRITWVSTTKNPLRDLDGKTVGTFGISRDVTNSKYAEIEMQKRRDWFDNFFKFNSTGFVVLDQNGKVSFVTESILSKVNRNQSEDLVFEDIFGGKEFSEFLSDIDYENTKDKKFEMELLLNDKAGTSVKAAVISGSRENEDETRNIFIIQE